MDATPPEPPRSPLRLRPLGVGELLDESFRMFRDNFPLFAGLGLVSALPGLISSLLQGGARSQGQIFTLFSGSGGAGQAIVPTGTTSPLLVVLGIAIVLAAYPFTLALGSQAAIDMAAGERPAFGRVLSEVASRYWALWGVFLFFLLGALPIITCIGIPVSVWLLIRWSVAIPALLAEGVAPGAAIGRSTALSQGNWWRMLGILLLSGLLLFVIEVALGGVLGLIIGLIPGLSSELRGAGLLVATALVGGLVRPIASIINTLLYFDLRIRREALELDILASQTGSQPQLPVV